MFAKKAIIAVASLFAVASAAPAARESELVARNGGGSFQSFNNFNGFSSLSNFDDFFGGNNFNGFLNEQIFVQQNLFCTSLPIHIVQQKLFILQELSKQIILSQICEVEVQTIVLQQFSAGFNVFDLDLRHLSGRQAAFDFGIANRFGSLFNSDGSLSTIDLGFNGLDIGKNNFLLGGFNWNDFSSPSSVGNAQALALAAAGLNLPSFS